MGRSKVVLREGKGLGGGYTVSQRWLRYQSPDLQIQGQGSLLAALISQGRSGGQKLSHF